MLYNYSMKTKTSGTVENEVCDLCNASKPLTKTILKVFGTKGWEEQKIRACKDCMIMENLVEEPKEKAA